ncbi:MAG: carboxypeptidase regulatory-like domain-containing protein, partial [Bryobacter sp.]|nr:carboxypeptidase regulatory-like domain-containing protein [Bryobacter sp.]
MTKWIFVGLLGTLCAHGQIVTGTIAGTVTDPSGLPVPSAQVTLVQPETGRERRTETNQAGDFVISGLDAGKYVLTIAGSGFKKYELRDINLPTGERLPLGELKLDIGQVTETISVAGRTAVVQTQSAERADVITSSQVENLAIRGRNVQDLMSLMPGVVTGTEQEGLSSTSSINVQGARATMNNISVDGVPATDMGNGSQLKVTVSQDAVSEVKMLVGNYQAEYGRMAGSNVQIVTKSGTREFHGLFSYFKRHEQFNANSFFNNLNSQPKGRYRFNTWTYNIGGPVILPGLKFNRERDKLFFFWHQEFWPTQGTAGGQVTMPTTLERQGNFSQSIDVNNRPITVRDPYNNNTPFAGNIIPSSRQDPNGIALLKFFPEPNFLDRSISRGQYNYVFQSPTSTPKRTNTLKLDYNLNPNNTISFGYSLFKDVSEGAFGTTTAAGNWPIMKKNWTSVGKSTTARYTKIISPTMLNEFSFGWLAQPADNFFEDSELKKVQRETVGYRLSQFTPSANPLNIIPSATFGGVQGAANIQTEGRFPLFNRYHLVSFSDNLTWTKGQHTLKFGTYIETFYRHQKKSVNFVGAFNFGQSANNPLDTGYAYGNAALGTFQTYSEISGEAWMKVRTGGYEFFAQDNWKVSRKLTLDYGLRMYILQPIWEQDNFMAGYVPQKYDPGKAVNLNRGIQWGPRVGFAYDLTGDGKTAIRGGFGMFYNRFFTELYSNTLVGQPPLLNEPIINFGEMRSFLSSTGLLYPQAVFSPDREGKLPTIMNFSFSVQRDVGWGTVVDVGYSGSLGRHLQWRRDINPIPMGANFDPSNFDPTLPGRPLPPAFLRPVAGYNGITSIEGASSSNYHSLQATARRRFVKGFQFGVAYTWSKALAYNDSDTEAISSLISPRVWSYGLADYDRTHVAKINYIWEG